MVLTLESVDEMLKCDSSDVIERNCSRWNKTVPEILNPISVQIARNL